jgi:hypothetical protein
MKFPLPELMTPLSALWETSRARNARRGRAAPSRRDPNADLTHLVCTEGDAANGFAAIGPGHRQVVGGAESRGPTHYRTTPRLRSKKKRFG